MAELNFEILEPTENEERSFEPLPDGWYKAAVMDEELRTSNAGNEMLNMTFEITEAEHEGRRVWNNYNLWHPKSDVVEIAQRQFSDLARACGLSNCRDSGELIGLLLDIQLKIEPGNGQYGPKNKIVAYRAAPAASAPKKKQSASVEDPPWTR